MALLALAILNDVIQKRLIMMCVALHKIRADLAFLSKAILLNVILLSISSVNVVCQ